MIRHISTTALLLCFSVIAICQARYIQVNGDSIRINTIGLDDRIEGQPVIVFESGHGTPMGNWDRVIANSNNLGPMITYDRPGVGASPAIEEMPMIRNVADRLVNVLRVLELEPPYILVGHSLGGVYVRGFAVYYPDLLAGLVIIDPGDFTETQVNKRDYYEVFNWTDERIDQEIAELDRKTNQLRENTPPALQRERQVLRDLRATDFEEITSSPLPNIPVHILVGGRFDMPKQLRSNEYDSEALFRSKIKHRMNRWTDVIQSVDKGMILYSGDAGHFVHWDDPELAIASIKIVTKDCCQEQGQE